MKDLVAAKGPKMAVVWVEVAVKACWDLATLATASADNICIVWRIIRVSPFFAPAWDRIGAALARSKRLNQYPEVAAYFCHVR